ncbi:spinocerebellar ataxia type 10 protein domain-containing protein [Dipodascopsis uninucleata]
MYIILIYIIIRGSLGESIEYYNVSSEILSSLRTVLVKRQKNEITKKCVKLINCLLSISMSLMPAGMHVQEMAYPILFPVVISFLDCLNSSEVASIGTSCFRTLVNLSASNEDIKAQLWREFLGYMSTENITRILHHLSKLGITALLVLIIGCIGSSNARSEYLLESENGCALLRSIIQNVDAYNREEDNQNFELVYSIVESLIIHGVFVHAYKACGSLTSSITSSQLVLVKLLDGYLSSLNVVKADTAVNLSLFLCKDLFFELCKPICIQFMEKKTDIPDADVMSEFVLVVLECISSLAMISRDMKDVIVGFNTVPEFIDLLRRADELIKRKTLKSGLPEKDGDNIGKPWEFPNMKLKLVGILSVLAEKNRTVQDQVRECGGLPVILSQCNIDDNNPFIREYAILCIKGLLENNKENQDFVASLEARESLTSDVLREAGYEATIIDGKVALKKQTI